jgi:NhaA family Na+:H+ antiporter
MNSHGVNDMNEEVNPTPKVKTGVYHAPWEKSFDKILTPFEEFIHRQTTSGLLLMAKTGILAASLLAGVAGFIWLDLVSKPAEAED